MNKVAIMILTKNRADFIIRQLQYYKAVKSPHPVYILDSSDNQDADKIKDYISQNKEPKTTYLWTESGNQPFNKLLALSNEKYACFSGDDDYQIPDSLSECAKFLESNPDFVSCGGKAVTVRIQANEVYGKIERISDYPRKEILYDLPEERFLNLMNNYCVYLFNVTRTETHKKMWDYLFHFSDPMVEIYPVSQLVIDGKVKLIDNLQFIRQIHKKNNNLGSTVNWLATHFKDSYAQIKTRLPIPEKYIELGFEYLIRNSLNKYPSSLDTKPRKQSLNLRTSMANKFPILKRIYRRHIKPTFSWEVTQEDSKYPHSFKNVEDSISGKFNLYPD